MSEFEIDFIDEHERQYFEEARLGQDVRQFLNSRPGRYLHGRAKLVLQEAKESAIEVDLEEEGAKEKLRKLQQDARFAREFMRWCADAIENGEAAETQLDSYRDQGE